MTFTDIVFPSNNEQEFIKIAKKLNISSIVFCYTYDKFISSKNIKDDKIKINYAVFANDFKSIINARNKKLAVVSNSNDRQVFEQRFNIPLILFELENIANYDSLHSRHSGLNHVLCSLMEKNNILLGISFSQLLKAPFARRPYLIGRMMQNIRFARKYKTRMKMASFARSPYEMKAHNDMVSLGVILGMHPSEAKKALGDIDY